MSAPEPAGALVAQPLADFEGKAVRQAAVEMPGAAGGLRDAMKMAPQEFHQGDKVFVAIEGTIGKVRFEPIDRDDPAGDQRRVHVIVVEGATFVDESVVAGHIAKMQEAIARKKEQSEGISRLPTDDEVELLGEEHANGEHASGLVPGCPECDDEALKEAEEASDPIPIAGRKGKGGGS